MKKIIFDFLKIVILSCPLLVFGDVKKYEDIFQAEKLPSNYKFADINAKRIADPAGRKGQVISFELPADTHGKDKSKRPEVILQGGALLNNKLNGYDEVVFTAYNPSSKPVNLVLCFIGKAKHYKGISLQPQTWSHNLFNVAEMQKVTGNRLKSIHIFNTNPVRSRLFYLESIKPAGSGFADNQTLSSTLKLAEPQDGKIPQGWELVNVKLEAVKHSSKANTNSFKITFPAYKKNTPEWPALQIWPGAKAAPVDWSIFSSLNFTLRNPGYQMIPLVMLIQDANGARRSFDCLLPAGQTVEKKISLQELRDFDISRVKQVDFFMHKPSEKYEFYLDDIHLKTISSDDLKRWNNALTALQGELHSLSGDFKKDYLLKLEAYKNRLKQFQLSRENTRMKVSELRELKKLEQGLSGWFDGCSRELTSARIKAHTLKDFPGTDFGVATADSMTKVMIADRPLTGVHYSKSINLALAKNEYESAQVVITGGNQPHKVKVHASSLSSADKKHIIPTENIEISLVGYVKTGNPLYKVDYQGWWPDPLLTFQSETVVKPGEAVPFWLTVKAPENIPAGMYHGKVMIESDKGPKVELPLEVRVFDFTVPSGSLLKIASNFRTQEIRRIWGDELSDEDYAKLLNQITDTLGKYKITLDSIYRRSFTGPQNLEIHLEQLKRFKQQGVLNYFNICYVGGIKKDITDVNHPSVQKSIDNALQTIDYWAPILKKEGLWEYAQVYGFDEAPPEFFPVIAKVFKAIKQKYPDLPLATTAYDHSLGTNSVLEDAVDIFIPLTSKYDQEIVKKSRAENHKVWWYICVIPHAPYANWLIEYPAIDARILMGFMTYMYRPDGFLYYSLNTWKGNRKPVSAGPYTTWNPASYKTANGDGYLFYPGPDGILPSIRAENIRDGLEDYAYFMILEELLKKSSDREKFAKTLAISPDLVASLKDFTKNPELLRKKRQEVAEAIEKIRNSRKSSKK